jgi:hypothetical protein
MRDEEVGSAEASERTGVSRPQLINACQSGVLPHRVVDGQRRVRMEDVLAYAKTVPPPPSKQERLRGLREMMRISQEAGEDFMEADVTDSPRKGGKP